MKRRLHFESRWLAASEADSLGGGDTRVRMMRTFKTVVMLPVLLAALAWGESFARRDIVWILCPDGGTVVSSSAGKLKVLVYIETRGEGWSVQHQSLPAEKPNRIDPLFQFYDFHTALQADLPHWFLVLLLAVPAMLNPLLARRWLTNPKSPPNQHMQPDPAMISLFHAERHWRGAADVQRWA
jgi:hypothetical protein